MNRPIIALTMGDPAGIGPEIIVKALTTGVLQQDCRPLVVGDLGVLRKAAALLGSGLSFRSVETAGEAEGLPDRADVLDRPGVDLATHRWGVASAASGRAVVDYVRTAVRLALERDAAAVVTAPISKETLRAAGFTYPGHTELLAELTGAKEYGMLFVASGLCVILATIHVALRDVPRLVTRDRVYRAIRLADMALRQLGTTRPRIGVAALNPHAGEGGLFGNEDHEEVLPAVLAARAAGIDASDPLPADTLFFKARNGRFDVVVAMYHDQGLAPLKMLAFGSSVNVTVGLPIIRTSVDHGTAFDIAGTGAADPASLREAVKLAARFAAARAAGVREA